MGKVECISVNTKFEINGRSVVFHYQMVTLTKRKPKQPKNWVDAPVFVPVSIN